MPGRAIQTGFGQAQVSVEDVGAGIRFRPDGGDEFGAELLLPLAAQVGQDPEQGARLADFAAEPGVHRERTCLAGCLFGLGELAYVELNQPAGQQRPAALTGSGQARALHRDRPLIQGHGLPVRADAKVGPQMPA